MSRTRDLVGPSQGFQGNASRWTEAGGWVSYQSNPGPIRPSFESRCVDSVGKQNPHPLTINSSRRKHQPVNGKWANDEGTVEWRFQDYLAPPAYSVVDTTHLSVDRQSVSAATAKLLARTHPGRTAIALPSAIGELKDLPRELLALVKAYNAKRPLRIGNAHPSNQGKAYLAWKFGWEPIIRDIATLLDAQKAIDKRIRELNALRNNGGSTRRLKIHSATESDSSTSTLFTMPGVSLSWRRSRITTIEQWGTVKWVPSQALKEMPRSQMNRLAADAVYGLSGNHFSDVWQLMPWSWLIDYFSNVGNLIENSANRVPVIPTDICIMTHRVTKYDWTRTDSTSWASGGAGSATYESKERQLGSLSLSASIPMFSVGQLSILGALVASRSR